MYVVSQRDLVDSERWGWRVRTAEDWKYYGQHSSGRVIENTSVETRDNLVMIRDESLLEAALPISWGVFRLTRLRAQLLSLYLLLCLFPYAHSNRFFERFHLQLSWFVKANEGRLVVCNYSTIFSSSFGLQFVIRPCYENYWEAGTAVSYFPRI